MFDTAIRWLAAKRDGSAEGLGSESGFTLIELMVVVLIIAILMAIAIPTFLGAKGSAQDRAAQELVRNALTNAETVFANTQSYSSAAPSSVDINSMKSADPALSWQTACPCGAGLVLVGIGAVNAIEFAATSATNKCWMIYENPVQSTFYGEDTGNAAGCTVAIDLPGPTVQVTPAYGTTPTWSTTGFPTK